MFAGLISSSTRLNGAKMDRAYAYVQAGIDEGMLSQFQRARRTEACPGNFGARHAPGLCLTQ